MNEEQSNEEQSNDDISVIRPVYLRPGVDADDPAEARFSFLGIDCLLHLDQNMTIRVYKFGVNGQPTKKPIAVGTARMQEVQDERHPVLKGVFRTGRDSMFELAGWAHTDSIDEQPYMSMEIKPLVVRRGFFPTAKAKA